MEREIVVIAHNIRSAHNVGSLFRTCDGIGVKKLYLTGFTPYPSMANDVRLPHESNKTTKQIEKTALGSIYSVTWEMIGDIDKVLAELITNQFCIAALEQNNDSTQLNKYTPPKKLAIILGNEVKGIDVNTLLKCNVILEIPMLGNKESFNVVQAAAMALYAFRYMR